MCPGIFEPLIPPLQMRIKKLDKDQKLGVSLCFLLAQGFCSSKLVMLCAMPSTLLERLAARSTAPAWLQQVVTPLPSRVTGSVKVFICPGEQALHW